jgi:DNA-binding transcriptional LysR family regulator
LAVDPFGVVREAAGQSRTTGRVGDAGDRGLLAVAPLVSRLMATFPNVSLCISVADSAHLVEEMMRDEIDFAIVNGPPADERRFTTNCSWSRSSS